MSLLVLIAGGENLMKLLGIGLISLLLLAGLLAADPLPVVADYRLVVAFHPEESRIAGEAVITFANEILPTETEFYLHGELTVDSVKQGDNHLEFTQEKVFYYHDYSLVANRVHIRLIETAKSSPLHVFYQGYFNKSKARSPSDYMHIDPEGVFLRSYGYSLWFPVFLRSGDNDYKVDFTHVRVVTPAALTTVFTGHHIGDTLIGDTRISTWQAEQVRIADAQLTAQIFRSGHLGDVHVYYWPDSASEAAADDVLGFVRDFLFLAKEWYRSEADAGQFHILEMPKYGDISSGNITAINHMRWKGFRENDISRRVMGHELVHPFVYPRLDNTDPLYALFIEGAPSYFHLPILEKLLGQDWYADFLTGVERRYLENRKTGLDRRGNRLPPEIPIDRITADRIGTYKDTFVLSDRALLFFHYLRTKMGDTAFLSFAKELFSAKELNGPYFRKTVLKYLPSAEDDLTRWLSTTEFPEGYLIANQ